MGLFDFLKKIPTAQYLGFLGNVAEGALNAVSGASANQTNKEIAQMNNQFNERMMDKQFQYQVQMMNEQNRYNSAESQVQRLREAGLNPALALGQVASGSATSANTGSPSMPSAQGVQVSPIQFNGLSDAMQYLLAQRSTEANVNKVQAETKNIQLQNQFYAVRSLADLNNVIQQGKGMKLDNKMKQLQSNLYGDMLQEQYKNMQLQNMDLQQSTQMKHFQTLMLEKQFNVFDTEFKMRMSDLLSQIELRMSQKQLTENQATHEVLKWLETNERTSGIKVSNDTNRRMADYLVEKARKETFHDNPISLAHDSSFSLFRAIHNQFR